MNITVLFVHVHAFCVHALKNTRFWVASGHHKHDTASLIRLNLESFILKWALRKYVDKAANLFVNHFSTEFTINVYVPHLS